MVAGPTYREAPEVDGLVFAVGRAEPGSRVNIRIEASAEYDLFGSVVALNQQSGPRVYWLAEPNI